MCPQCGRDARDGWTNGQSDSYIPKALFGGGIMIKIMSHEIKEINILTWDLG